MAAEFGSKIFNRKEEVYEVFSTIKQKQKRNRGNQHPKIPVKFSSKRKKKLVKETNFSICLFYHFVFSMDALFI